MRELVSSSSAREPLDVFAGIADEPGTMFAHVPDPACPTTLFACRPVDELRLPDTAPDPLAAVAEFVARQPAGDPAVPMPMRAGIVGLIGYEAGRAVAPRADHHTSPQPAALVRRYDPFVAYEHRTGTYRVLSPGDRARPRWLDRLEQHAPSRPPVICPIPLTPSLSSAAYRQALGRIKAYLAAGDIYQANFTQAFRTRLDSPASALFLRLTAAHPAPHAAYMDAGDFQVVMNSPELFLRVRGPRIETRPIKGTRARDPEAAVDTQHATALASDPKERAEHVMIVDLERNDLGRVCHVGSVHVDQFADVVSLPTVHHLVTRVHGTLRDDADLATVLTATFPGGSITGAPKIRAMEIIAELEADARGVYTGALGLFDPSGDVELGLPIRTAVVTRGMLTYRAGGGIVIDSDPDKELAESWAKTAGLRRVLGASAGEEFDRCSSG